MSPNHIRAVAAWEWRTIVRRREFVIATITLPILFALIVVLSSISTFSAARREGAIGRVQRSIGIVTGSVGLNVELAQRLHPELGIVSEPDEDAAKRDVAEGRIWEAFVPSWNYLQSGSVTVYQRRSDSLFGNMAGQSGIPGLRGALIAGRVPADLFERVVTPVSDPDNVYQWDEKTQRFMRPDPLGGVGKFGVAYAFCMLLLLTTVTCTSYLLGGIAEEKESRMIEILMSSITHRELLLGKVIGAGSAGLTQLGIWLALGAVPAAVGLAAAAHFVHISPGILALAVALFVLGFAFYGTLIGAIGSLGTSWKESQQITGVIMMMMVIPIMFMPMIVDDPNGATARILSWLPPTAAQVLMMRVTSGDVAGWEIALSLLLLALGTAAVQNLSAKLFRLGLLMQGKAPTVREVFRWLREN